AVRWAWERAAHASSSTSRAAKARCGNAQVSSRRARSRSAGLVKKARSDSGEGSSIAVTSKSVSAAWIRSGNSGRRGEPGRIWRSTRSAGQVRTGSAEDVLDPIEQPFVVLAVEWRGIELLGRQRGGELLEQPPLLLRQLLRGVHLDRDEQVAA